MEASVRQRWINELRSGKWKECYGILTNGRNSRCGVGVLLEAMSRDCTPCNYASADDLLGSAKQTEHYMRLFDRSHMTFEQLAKHLEKEQTS